MNLNNRKYLLQILVLFTSLVFGFRLLYMQLIDDSWALRAHKVAERRREVIPPRGIIYDRNMKKIVTNKISYNLMFIEEKLPHFDTLALAKILGWKKSDVVKRLEEIKKKEGFYFNPNTNKREANYRKDRAYPFVKDLSFEEIIQIAPNLGGFGGGIYEEPVGTRYYPYPVAGNVFGYISEVNPEEIRNDPFYRSGMNIGRSGIERSYENILRGKKGVRYIVTDASAHEMKEYSNKKFDTMAKPSPRLILGLDIQLQLYGESIMKNKKGCIIAIEPESGEILALISSPGYDPNLLAGRKQIIKNYPKLNSDNRLPLYNRPLQAEYAPGSIFKLAQALICLQERKITRYSGFKCNKDVVGCHEHPAPNSLTKAIQYSCNPYFYAAVKRVMQPNKRNKSVEDVLIGMNTWYNYMMLFGFGSKLGVDIALSAQRGGFIPNAAFYDRFLGKKRWNFSDISSNSIGQGEIKLTPMQMANLGAIIANRGWYITPHFVKSVGKLGKKREFNIKHSIPIDVKNFEIVIAGMRAAVNGTKGTGSAAKNKDFVVCGKTGTIQNGKNKKDHSAFLAFAPEKNPKIVLLVFIENAGSGGGMATNIASLILEKYLLKEVKDQALEKLIKTGKIPNKKDEETR